MSAALSGFHTSAVKNADFNIASAQRQDIFVDKMRACRRFVRRWRLCRTDRPNRLVGNGDVFGVQTLQDGKLMGNDFVFFTGSALFQRRRTTMESGTLRTFFHFAALISFFSRRNKGCARVADEDDVCTDVGKHSADTSLRCTRRYSGKRLTSCAQVKMRLFKTSAWRCAVATDKRSGRPGRLIRVRRLDDAEAVHKCIVVLESAVHFPVADNPFLIPHSDL